MINYNRYILRKKEVITLNEILGILSSQDEINIYVETLRKFGNLSLLAVCIIAYAYGAVILIKRKAPFFASMPMMGILCEAMRCLFVFSCIWSTDYYPQGYNTASLSNVAVFLLLSGTAMGLKATGRKKSAKILPVIVAALPILPLIYVCTYPDHIISQNVQCAIMTAAVCLCVFVNFRLILTPDTDGNKVSSFRPYFILVIVYCVAALTEMTVLCAYPWGVAVCHNILLIVSYLVQCVSYLLMPLLIAKGVDKWKT